MLVTLQVPVDKMGVPYCDSFGIGMITNPIEGQFAFFDVKEEGGIGRTPYVYIGGRWVPREPQNPKVPIIQGDTSPVHRPFPRRPW